MTFRMLATRGAPHAVGRNGLRRAPFLQNPDLLGQII
jgi:hypothetical protein